MKLHEEPLALGGVFLVADLLAKPKLGEVLKLALDVIKRLFSVSFNHALRLLPFGGQAIKLGDKKRKGLRRDGESAKPFGKLGFHFPLRHVGLLTGLAFDAVVVRVEFAVPVFLVGRGDGAAALATTEKTRESPLVLTRPRLIIAPQHGLEFGKLLGSKHRLVGAFVQLALKGHQAAVEGIGEQVVKARPRDRFAAAPQALGRAVAPSVVEDAQGFVDGRALPDERKGALNERKTSTVPGAKYHQVVRILRPGSTREATTRK